MRAPEGFSEGKHEAAKPRGRSPQGFAVEGLPEENPEGALTLPRSIVSAPKGNLLRGQLFYSAPRIFNSCSDNQNHEVYWRMKQTVSVFDRVYNLLFSSVIRNFGQFLVNNFEEP